MINDREPRRSLLSCLPSVHVMQRQPRIQDLLSRYDRRRLDAIIRKVLNDARARIRHPNYVLDKTSIKIEDLTDKVVANLDIEDHRLDKLLINASGILFHPGASNWNAGTTARRASELALRLAPFPKTDRISRLLCELTGAEDALVTHSIPAAFLLAVQSYASGKEVIINRNQLGLIDAPYNDGPVDPVSICKLAGSKLVEVGATNKTGVSDYRSAIRDQTALVAYIRPSTYALRGFTAESGLEEILEAGVATNTTVLYLAGDTTLRPLISAGYRSSCSVSEAVRFGAPLIISASGGLIGGPPCGLLFGSRRILEGIRKHGLWPTMQAAWHVRAGLEARLTEMAQGSHDFEGHPTEGMLTASKKEIGIRARALLNQLSTRKRLRGAFSIVERPTYLTTYRLPNDSIASFSVSVRPDGALTEDLARYWACSTPSLLVNYDRSQLLIDIRGVGENQMTTVSETINNYL